MLLKIPIIIMLSIVGVLIGMYQIFMKTNQSDVEDVPVVQIPEGFDRVVYCNSCQAIIRQTLEVLRMSKNQLDIEVTLDMVCKTEFQGYPFVSGVLQDGCKVFLSGWRKYLITKLQYRSNNQNVEKEFCVDYTKACENIDPIKIQLEVIKESSQEKFIMKGGTKTLISNITNSDLENDQPLDDDI